MMSPSHECVIIFVFDLAKNTRLFSAFHMNIFGLSFMLGYPGQGITFFLYHLHELLMELHYLHTFICL